MKTKAVILMVLTTVAVISIKMSLYFHNQSRKQAVIVPVICDLYDQEDKECITHFNKKVNVRIPFKMIHLKRPINFYTETECWIGTWNKNRRSWSYPEKCERMSHSIVMQLNGYKLYKSYVNKQFTKTRHFTGIKIELRFTAKGGLITERV